jgi:hypothetical protein
MTVDKQRLERRAVLIAIQSYLESAGYTGPNAITYREGFRSDQPIVPPTVSVTFISPAKTALQMGGSGHDSVYKRTVQVDAYMESEQRASSVCDLVMDFMDLVPIGILDGTGSGVGSLICQDTESIISELLPPILTNPKSIRWRGVIKGVYEAYYPNG